MTISAVRGETSFRASATFRKSRPFSETRNSTVDGKKIQSLMF